MFGVFHMDVEAVEVDLIYGVVLLAELFKIYVLVIYCGGGGCDFFMCLVRILVDCGWSCVLVYEGGW